MTRAHDLSIRIVHILASRNWHLVSPDDQPDWQRFVNQLMELKDIHYSDDPLLDRAVTYAYCPVLLVACREGGCDRQERAFTELHQWIYPRVYARIGNAQDAEDVAQQVLVRVYQNLHRVEKPHGFLGYVSVILRHEVIDYFRRKGKIDQLEQEISWKFDDNGDDDGMDDLEGPDSFLKADVEAAEEELIRMIYECMPKKKWRRAHALVAVALKEQTVPEVAAALRTTPTAVHLLLFRAREDLPQHCPGLIEFLRQRLTPSQRLSLEEGNP